MPIRKKSGKLSYSPRIYIYIYTSIKWTVPPRMPHKRDYPSYHAKQRYIKKLLIHLSFLIIKYSRNWRSLNTVDSVYIIQISLSLSLSIYLNLSVSLFLFLWLSLSKYIYIYIYICIYTWVNIFMYRYWHTYEYFYTTHKYRYTYTHEVRNFQNYFV